MSSSKARNSGAGTGRGCSFWRDTRRRVGRAAGNACAPDLRAGRGLLALTSGRLPATLLRGLRACLDLWWAAGHPMFDQVQIGF